MSMKTGFRIREQTSNNSHESKERPEHRQAVIALAAKQTALLYAHKALIPKHSGGNSWRPQQAESLLADFVPFTQAAMFYFFNEILSH